MAARASKSSKRYSRVKRTGAAGAAPGFRVVTPAQLGQGVVVVVSAALAC